MSEGPSAGIDRAFLRLTFWQTILAVAGVFTGAVALYAALNESKAVRDQTAATVWPYVQVVMNDHSSEEAAYFNLHLSNVGVGPAKMRSMQLKVDGQPVSDWATLIERLLGEDADTSPGNLYGRNTVSRRVIAPGESVAMIQTSDRELAMTLQRMAYAGRAQLSYCYCSIFDDCWAFSMFSVDYKEPLPVKQCPDFGSDSFND